MPNLLTRRIYNLLCRHRCYVFTNQPQNSHFLIAIIALSILQPGCATTSFPELGIRPSIPEVASRKWLQFCGDKEGDASQLRYSCAEFYSYREYAENLGTAYLSRSTLNRWGIWFGGFLGLSGLTASSGLAAANAGIEALRIVPLVSGFLAGLSALTQNQRYADAYTIAASKIGVAIVNAETIVSQPSQTAPRSDLYNSASIKLKTEVIAARNELEQERTKIAETPVTLDQIVKDTIAKYQPPTCSPNRIDDLPAGESIDISCNGANQIDPSKTSDTAPGIAKVSYDFTTKIATIIGENSGSTTITLKDTQGLPAPIKIEIVSVNQLNIAAGSANVNVPNLEVGQKLSYRLPDKDLFTTVASNDPHFLKVTTGGNGRWIVIEAIQKTAAA
jgi:hypothetical protein